MAMHSKSILVMPAAFALPAAISIIADE